MRAAAAAGLLALVCAARAAEAPKNAPHKPKHPKIVGAVVRSDKWKVIRREDREREEFTGNVSYSREGDKSTADRAVYDKQSGVFDLMGRAYTKRYLELRGYIELWSDRQSYDFEKELGESSMDGDGQARMRWTDPGRPEGSGLARRILWDEAAKTVELKGRASVEASSRTASGASDRLQASAERALYGLHSQAGSAEGGPGAPARLDRDWADGRKASASAERMSWTDHFGSVDLEGRAQVRLTSPTALSRTPEVLEASADRAHYDADGQKGWAKAGGAEPVRARRTWADGRDLSASGREAAWDSKADKVELTGTRAQGPAELEYRPAAGEPLSARALSVAVDGKARSALLQGGAVLRTSTQTARAEWARYDDDAQELRLKDGPPVLEFSDPDYRGALRAERVRSLAKEQRLEAHGSAEGWIHYEEKDAAQSRKPD